MGTAGHIDHGKTTLVKALTGIDCDRLAEEKKRGITIELGFAHTQIDGREVGIVDVPGHERFVKHMVAGATGIDFVLLVIAADEGVMPQTREHIAICSLLGIERGVVALTKTDGVDEEWLDLVREDVRDFLSDTFLAQAPLVPVSAHTGAGLDHLRRELRTCMEAVQANRALDLVRLPIDRVFTMRGHGTVITGTMVSGRLEVGQEVTLYPRGQKAKVRQVQVHGRGAEQALAGQRTAVNLLGLEVEDVQRGEVVGLPGTLFPSKRWDAELSCLPGAPRPLKHRTEVHLHHGAAEYQARIFLFDADALRPGETRPCQVVFAEPVAALFGDRFVVRSFSPLQTVGGGRVLHPLAPRRSRRRTDPLSIAALADAEDAERVRMHLAMAGAQGVSLARLRVVTDIEGRALSAILGRLSSAHEVVCYDRDQQIYVHGEVMTRSAEDLLETVRAFHRENPQRRGVAKSVLASGWGRLLPAKLFHLVVEKLKRQGAVEYDQDLLWLPGHSSSLSEASRDVSQEVLDLLRSSGLMPPLVKEMAERFATSDKELLKVLTFLQEQGEVTKVQEGMFMSSEALNGLKERVAVFFRKNEEMRPADFKELSGVSRKFAIPLLELLDRERLTMRVGEVRKARRI